MARALRAAKLPRFVPDESVNVACLSLMKDMGVVFAALPQSNRYGKHIRMCVPHLCTWAGPSVARLAGAPKEFFNGLLTPDRRALCVPGEVGRTVQKALLRSFD
jgi:hypothetical protein